VAIVTTKSTVEYLRRNSWTISPVEYEYNPRASFSECAPPLQAIIPAFVNAALQVASGEYAHIEQPEYSTEQKLFGAEILDLVAAGGAFEFEFFGGLAHLGF
jgi:hypothetical protein